MSQAIKASTSLTLYSVDNQGILRMQLNANQPVHQNYDPNTNTYQPDYTKSNLKITPTILYNADAVSLTDARLTLTWKRKIGSSAETNLSSGESVSAGVLTVNQNILSSAASPTITYVCYVKYEDASQNIILNDRDVMSFTLLSTPEELKYISLSGENTFLYNSAGSLISPGQITLTANATNVSIAGWKYKDSTGAFKNYPNTSENPTLTDSALNIKPSHPIFFNDIAVIKVETSVADVYDIMTITKLRDGAVGDDAIMASLSNDSHTLPASSSGVVPSSAFTDALTKITVYEGSVDATSSWTISAAPSTGIKGSFSADDASTYKVTEMSSDNGYVDLTASKTGKPSITKRFTLSKSKGGTSARVYMLETDVGVINKSVSGTLTPPSITFSAYYRDGSSAVRTPYSGRFIVAESTNGTSFTNTSSPTTNQSSLSYTPTGTCKAVKCTLYAAGGTTNALDEQTILVVSDGQTGEAAINVIVGNESHVIPCTSNGNVLVTTDVTIPFYGYQGTKRVPCTVTVSKTLPDGISVLSNTADNGGASGGSLVLRFAQNKNLGASATKTGEIDLTFTCLGKAIMRKFSWTKSPAAENSILFEVQSIYGNVIMNGVNNVELSTVMYTGIAIATPSSYLWKQFESGAWKTVSTASKLIVTPDMVQGAASFSCTAVYNGKEYTAYATVLDKKDNYQAELISSSGTAFKNCKGTTVLYSIVYQNGSEIDELKSNRFLTSSPSSASAGDFYYHINKSVSPVTVTLKKYSTSWADASGSDLPQLEYNIYRTDADGLILDDGEVWRSGKAVYFDVSEMSTLKDKKCNFILQVTDKNNAGS